MAEPADDLDFQEETDGYDSRTRIAHDAGGLPQPRVSVRAREARDERDSEYDLLTAALIGVTIGAGPRSCCAAGHPAGADGAGDASAWVAERSGPARNAARAGRIGARWAAKRGGELWDRIPRDEIREHVSDYRDHVAE